LELEFIYRYHSSLNHSNFAFCFFNQNHICTPVMHRPQN